MHRYVLLLALGLSACPPPDLSALPPYCEPAEQACPPGASSSSGEAEPAPEPTGGVQTVTGPEPDTTSSDTGDLGSTSTTDEPPIPPPMIVEEPTLTPDPLKSLGAVDASVLTANADGVRMRVDDGDQVELGGGPDTFVGGAPFYSGLSNGTHKAEFVAWRGNLQSEPEVVFFEVDLPKPGQGYVWESLNFIGLGTVAAIVALPHADSGPVMVELGTYYPVGKPRCYLRRRDADGAWNLASDVVEVLPDVPCIAIDLEVDSEGRLYLLVMRDVGIDDRWWLGRVDTWESAATPLHRNSGAPGDTAHALTVRTGKEVVCGTRSVNNPFDKLDAAIAVTGYPVRLFDYVTDNDHQFDETLRDCALDGNTLVAVGDIFGWLDGNKFDPKRRHHLQLRLDLGTDLATAHVGAELGSATQSVANALTILSDSRVVTVGYLCGDMCQPEAQLWVHASDGSLKWYAALGADLAAPFGIAASPAGYVVLGGAVKKSPVWSQFWMSAYFIGEYKPVWTFTRDDAPVFQYATTVAVGPEGHVYGGGVGAAGYPAIVYIRP